LAAVLLGRVLDGWLPRILVLVAASAVGYYFNWLPYLFSLSEDGWRWLIASAFALLAVAGAAYAPPGRRKLIAVLFGGMALVLVLYNLSPLLIDPFSRWGRTLPGINLPKVIARTTSLLQ